MGHLLFDEKLSFLLDCDLYKRYYTAYGSPKVIKDLSVVIGVGDHQTSHIMPESEKGAELKYVLTKTYA